MKGVQMKGHFLWTALTGTYCLLWATTCSTGDENCGIIFLNNKRLLTEWRYNSNLLVKKVTVNSMYECQELCCSKTIKCNMFEFTHLMPTNNCAHLFCDQIEKCLEAQPDDYNASTTYILDDNETTTLTNISTTELPSVNTTETVFYNKSNPQMMGKAYSQDPETQSIMITSENSSDIEHSTPTTISNVKHTINSNVNKTKDIIDHPRNGVTISKSKSLMSKGQQQELSGNFSTESGFLNWSDKVLNDSQNNDIYENEMYVHDNESLIIVVPTQLSNNNYYKKSHHHDMTSETKVNNEQISSFATDSFHSSLQMTVFGGNTNVNESFRVIQVLYPDIHQSVFLIISLIAGFLILLIVIGLIFKHVHNTWERRHYQKMNIMIE